MGPRDGFVVVLVLLVSVQPVGAVVSPQPVAQMDSQIVRTMTFSLTPDEPGTVDVEMAFSIPDAVEEFRTGIPAGSTVIDRDGFSQESSGNFSWDGQTDGPTLTVSLRANSTSAYHYDGPSSGLTFADTGSWALVSVPSVAASWTYRGLPAPTFERRVRVAGEGVAGTQMVFLGENTATTRTFDDQQVTLVVPAASRLEAEPDEILGSLAAASRSLPVGDKPDRAMFVAAPTSVDWGPYGLAQDDDAWVRADQLLSSPNNVWIHEYVHIRQNFRTESDARWITEAMGEYYAASLTLEQGRIGFDEFRDHLELGEEDRYDGTVLSRPETWRSLANYVRGGLVFGNLDRRMRLATDARRPASRLFRAMNERDRPIDHAFLRREVASLAGEEPSRYLDRYATTDRTPSMWYRAEHTEAFSTLPPRMVTRIQPTVEITGPYRNRTVETIPTVVTGETLTFPVTVSNDGDATGEYETSLLVDGTVVTSVNGSLDGTANETHLLTHTFDTPGETLVRIGETTWNVSVDEPAPPVITTLDGPTESVESGASVDVSITIENRADRPAGAPIEIEVDGAVSETWRPRLDVSEVGERTVTLTFDEAGEHRVRVGDRTLTVTVTEPGSRSPTMTVTTATQTSLDQDGQSPDSATVEQTTATNTTVPGLGISIVILGLLVAVGWLRFSWE